MELFCKESIQAVNQNIKLLLRKYANRQIFSIIENNFPNYSPLIIFESHSRGL